MSIPIKKLLRPLVPDRVMARFRLAQHSRQVRTNVDIVTDDTAAARRWLTVTPDTYRARTWAGYDAGHERPTVAIGGEEARRAARLLSDPEIGAAVVGEVAPPRLVGRSRREPEIAPRAMAVATKVLDEVGPIDDLPALLQRIRDAGHRLALIPVTPAGAEAFRKDPVEGPVAVILAPVPLHDIGGGSRGARLALALLRHGFWVVHVALFGTAESTDLGLRFVHPRLEQLRFDQFDPDRLSARLGDGLRIVISELPAQALLAPLEVLRSRGFATVYDLIDDWSDPALGGEWYRPQHEASMVELADVLAASAPDLVSGLERFGRPVLLLPNAVDEAVFGRRPGPTPRDFPEGDGPVVGYHGSLYGNWIDWQGIRDVAEQVTGARVVVIGDDRGHPPLPDNVVFLGLKAHHELLDYIARFDVGIIPFAVSAATHAVSPLKAYEYLAAGVPVAGPPLRALAGLDGVHTDDDLVKAVTVAMAGPPPDPRRALAEHSWTARLESLFATAGWELPPAEEKGAMVVIRPVRHYSAAERRL